MARRRDKPFTRPTVSICIPAYNAASFIGQAIDSALAQTLQDFEIVVWDDASTDETPEIVRTIRDPRVRLFTSPVNRGSVRATNATLRLSRGTFIKFLHDDDVLEPDCLERLVEVMEQDPSVGLVFSRRALHFDGPIDDGLRAGFLQTPEPHLALGALLELNDGRRLFERLMRDDFKLNFIGEPSNVMVRRDRLERYGLCNLRVRQLVDLDLWLRAMHDCSVGFVDAKLATYRLHPGSLTSRLVGQRRQWIDGLWILEGLATVPEIWSRYPELSERRAFARRQLVKDLGGLAKMRGLRAHHLADAAKYLGYLARLAAGKPPVIIERLVSSDAGLD